MTRDELKENLFNLEFDYWRNEEYNRDEFSGYFCFLSGEMSFSARIDIQIDYYNVKIVWYYEKGKKASKNYYVNKELAAFKDMSDMLGTFFKSCIDLYKINIFEL